MTTTPTRPVPPPVIPAHAVAYREWHCPRCESRFDLPAAFHGPTCAHCEAKLTRTPPH